MKRYTKTFWNGMLEDPKGIWVKDEDVNDARSTLYNIINYHINQEKILEYSVLNYLVYIKVLSALLLIAIISNILQVVYYFN